MTTAGLDETSGDWLYDIGPARARAASAAASSRSRRGKGGLGTFAPLLDPAGNSVKGQLAARVPVPPARARRLLVDAGDP